MRAVEFGAEVASACASECHEVRLGGPVIARELAGCGGEPHEEKRQDEGFVEHDLNRRWRSLGR